MIMHLSHAILQGRVVEVCTCFGKDACNYRCCGYCCLYSQVTTPVIGYPGYRLFFAVMWGHRPENSLDVIAASTPGEKP